MSQTMVPGRPGALPPALLLARLRGDAGERPTVDPGFAGGLRDWLEDQLGEVVLGLAPSVVPVRVRKDRLTQVLLCEAHAMAQKEGPPLTFELARGTLADALFRLWVTLGHVGDPLADSLLATAASGGEEIANFVGGLGDEQRNRLAEELAEHAQTIAATWPVPSPGWLGRTQERIEVPLCGGAVLLSGVVDLAFGAPSSGNASVCLVEMKSGARRLEHRADIHYYALLETLRSGAPPFRIATYYSLTGELDAEQVGEDVLKGALRRLLDGTIRLCRLEGGAMPQSTPNPLCDWCAHLPCCEPGRRRVQSNVPRSSGDPLADGASVGREARWDEDES